MTGTGVAQVRPWAENLPITTVWPINLYVLPLLLLYSSQDRPLKRSDMSDSLIFAERGGSVYALLRISCATQTLYYLKQADFFHDTYVFFWLTVKLLNTVRCKQPGHKRYDLYETGWMSGRELCVGMCVCMCAYPKQPTLWLAYWRILSTHKE